MKPIATDVAIIGAGLAGLNCARTLSQTGLDVVLLEASDAPGGRIRTDMVDGFRLDRGFQVFLTAYPEAQKALRYDVLHLKSLKPGALVWHGNRFHHFADPFRSPLAAIGLIFDPIVTLGDKLRVAKLRLHVLSTNDAELFAGPEESTAQFLHNYGFSDEIVSRFFAPFFGGVFLDEQLATSSRFFLFLFRMFSRGGVAVPELGMEEIPRQMASELPAGVLRTSANVKSISAIPGGYRLQIGEAADPGGDTVSGSVESRWMVIATDARQAFLLLSSMSGGRLSGEKMAARLGAPRAWNRTTTFYYAADRAPGEPEPIVMLNGEGPSGGPANSVTVMSKVSAAYAPPGAELIAANVVGRAPADDRSIEALESDVRTQLSRWFPGHAPRWRLLGGYPIEFALPRQSVASWQSGPTSVSETNRADGAGRRLYVCGDYCETASIQGALVSGRRAAEALLEAAGRK